MLGDSLALKYLAVLRGGGRRVVWCIYTACSSKNIQEIKNKATRSVDYLFFKQASIKAEKSG